MSVEGMLVFLIIATISRSQSEEVISISNADTDVIPQCNSTCKYVDWAFDADCRQRNLEAVPQECWMAKMIDLRDNHISNITANAFEAFPNLLYVDLEENGITDIDTSAFVGNNRVRHIYLQSNRLETIRKGTFTGVPNLLQLYLNSNRISTIEVGAFLGLLKLETLFLSENLFDEIPSGLFDDLQRLRYLYITHNRLTALQNDTFKGLSDLHNLNLINNNIRTIDAGAFRGLTTLRVLRLAYNDISVIGYNAFFQMRYLIQLDLYSNRIQTISNFTTRIQNIEELYLGDNPLMCDCRLEPLRMWYKKHFVMDSKANATCHSPENTKGRAIANMDIKVCPISSESRPGKSVKDVPVPTKPVQTSYKRYSAVETSTIAVIVIACLVLFAVCFVGFICLVYNTYIRRTNYKHVSSDDTDRKDCILKITPNPLDPDA